MRKLAFFLLIATFAASAQTSPTSSTSSTAQTPAEPAKDTSTDKQKEQDKKKKDKKEAKKKKDDKSSGSQDAIDTSRIFTERIASDVIGRIRDGLEGHSRRLMLSAFDDDKMDGYLSFEDQIDSFFNRYEAFRVHFRIANVAIEGQKGVVLVDAEMEETPAAGGSPLRKRTQLRFELELGRKGWRVVDVRDRGFFS
jgi:hypothetical protein